MNTRPTHRIGRRAPLRAALGVGLGALASTLRVSAATRPLTPSQTEGPYYPVNKPTGAGSDLLHAGDGRRAEGTPLALAGRVFDAQGNPLPGITVEIWQCDQRGIYRHPRAPRTESADPAFAGYGETGTDAAGRYDFLTIVPVPYASRPPHIHAKIRIAGQDVLTTQLYPGRGGVAGRVERWFSRSAGALAIRPQPATLPGALAGMRASFNFVVRT